MLNFTRNLLTALLATALPAAARADDTDFFETSIRPLLEDRCYNCHSAEAKKLKASLRLDTKDGVLKGGESGPAIVPGDPDASLLVKAIRYTDPALQMPPKGRLAEQEIAVLTAWVKMGAPDPRDELALADLAQPAPEGSAPRLPGEPLHSDHWSFQPLADAAPPAVTDAAWVRSDVDRFVLARLEAEGLRPAPAANRRALIRRLSFVLTGLPPTPADVERFVADLAPDAEESLVDRLLASDACAERLARAWLDVARYADSNGLDENLAMSHAWRYRDWVIDAFRRDLPYDRFVTEQLAGDLLPFTSEAEQNARFAATGFLVLGPKMLAEQDKEKLQWDVVDEQLDVAGRAFLGLTLGCARCHDHKFDPIPQRDYSALAGIFKSTRTLGSVDFVSRWNERELPTAERRAAIEQHAADLAARRAEVDALVKAADVELLATLAARAPAAVAAARAAAGSVLFLEAEDASRTNLIVDRENWGNERHPILRSDSEGVQFVEVDLTESAARRVRVLVRFAAAEARPMALLVNGTKLREDALGEIIGGFRVVDQRFVPLAEIDLLAGRNVIRLERTGPVPHLDSILILPAGDVPDEDAFTLAIAARFEQAERAAPAVADDVAFSAALAADADEPFGLSVAERSLLYPAAAIAPLQAARDAVTAIEKAGPPPFDRALAVAEATAADAPVFTRGNHLAPSVDPVPRGFLSVLAETVPTPSIAPGASGRLDLARWITDPSNPLTARVWVNRVFALAFGQGLVRSPSNFGVRGEPPTHPELLDHLARRFMADGWSTRKLLKDLVLSATWRQSSAAPPQVVERDPDNRLLAHANLRRLEAEWLRDALLEVSGRLDRTAGGTLLDTKNGDYVTNDQSKDQAAYGAPRRSLYLPVVRNSLYDLFTSFDFGDPSMAQEQRGSTTTASQGLWLMNSPLMVECATAVATATAGEVEDGPRIDAAWKAALARTPTAAEKERCFDFLATARAAQQDPWPMLCQAILASNDFLYIE